MRWEDRAKTGEERVQAVADWAVFEALCDTMMRAVQDGRDDEANLMVEELARYLRGEGWSWAMQEVGPEDGESVHDA